MQNDFIKCKECGDIFNPAYLDQVATHMHAGINVDETLKGQRFHQTVCVTHEFVEVTFTASGQEPIISNQCRFCGLQKT